MDTKIVSVTDFLRNFGKYADMLPNVDKLILTREGRPYAEFKLTPEERNERLLALRGKWDGKLFGDDKFWKKVLKRKNRKYPIKL